MLARTAPDALLGHAAPRIGPPLPLRHGLASYRAIAKTLGIAPVPWQDIAASYLTALGPDDNWLYRELAAVVARQQGKTTLVKPLIVERLLAGRRIMHIAQVRELPRIMHAAVSDAIEAEYPELFPRRRGKIIWARHGAGSESIELTNGGSYRIAAAVSGGSRGFSFDDLILDEIREMDSFAVIDSAKPAQRMSANPQTIYLSNAGTDASVVLNALRKRAGLDASLAYLEWSAAPEFSADDRHGWVQANPLIGHFPQVLRDLEQDYLAASLSGNMAGFETESLCRWVPTMRERLVEAYAWNECEVTEAPKAVRPCLGVAMDPDGTRGSAAMAWQADEVVYLQMLYDVRQTPLSARLFGDTLRTDARQRGVSKVGYDPLTDGELAKSFTKPKSISGNEYANASATFVNLVKSGRLRWYDAGAVGDDLTWTARKPHGTAFEAVRADDDRPITAALAAIRAVWLASTPTPSGAARIY